MFYVFHKKILVLAAVITLITISMILLMGEHTPTVSTSERVVVIDPGHGGMDGGASGADGTLEKDINLSVAKQLQEKAEAAGYRVIMTRTEDTSLNDSDKGSIRKQKRADLKKRKEIANSSGALAFVSVHMNKFEESKYRGAQVFYSKNEDSKDLATKIQKSLIEGLDDGNNRVAKPSEDIYVLKSNNLPSVIVECGFLSNKEELALIKTPEYQSKVADCIVNGLNEFVNREPVQ